MHILPFHDATVQAALSILQQGGVVAHITETCYGFACDLSNPQAVANLFSLKKRPANQPVSALFSSVEEAKKFVVWNERAEELAHKHLPGPLTLILPLRRDTPVQLFSMPTHHSPPVRPGRPGGLTTHHSLGIRISSHPHAQILVAAFGSPISTTSANLHGEKNTYSAEDIVTQFEKESLQPELIIDSGPLPEGPPSTVIDCSKENAVQRQGKITIGH